MVENKVGAAGNIAADYVAKATDGHTLGLMVNGNMTIAKLLNPRLPYDPLQGWQVAGSSAEGLVANRVKADSALLGGSIAAQGIKAE